MEKEYLVSYHFQTKKTEGFAHCVIRVSINIKTSNGIKKLKDHLDRDVGGTVVILNIIELDIEEETQQEKSPE